MLLSLRRSRPGQFWHHLLQKAFKVQVLHRSTSLLTTTATFLAHQTQLLVSNLGLKHDTSGFFSDRRSNLRTDLCIIFRVLRLGDGIAQIWYGSSGEIVKYYLFRYSGYSFTGLCHCLLNSRLSFNCTHQIHTHMMHTHQLFINDRNLLIIIPTDSLKAGNDSKRSS